MRNRSTTRARLKAWRSWAASTDHGAGSPARTSSGSGITWGYSKPSKRAGQLALRIAFLLVWWCEYRTAEFYPIPLHQSGENPFEVLSPLVRTPPLDGAGRVDCPLHWIKCRIVFGRIGLLEHLQFPGHELRTRIDAASVWLQGQVRRRRPNRIQCHRRHVGEPRAVHRCHLGESCETARSDHRHVAFLSRVLSVILRWRRADEQERKDRFRHGQLFQASAIPQEVRRARSRQRRRDPPFICLTGQLWWQRLRPAHITYWQSRRRRWTARHGRRAVPRVRVSLRHAATARRGSLCDWYCHRRDDTAESWTFYRAVSSGPWFVV